MTNLEKVDVLSSRGEKSASPMVSVLMTSFNREKYISEAIESVLASTFRDFELIIVDDASQDRTVEIARNYADLDSRIRVVVNDSNLGDYNNRNKAASFAHGKYIKYVDSDDRIYPSTLDIMVSAMENHPAAALGISSREIDQIDIFPVLLDPASAYKQHFFVDGFLENGPLAVIIRRDAFNVVGGFTGKRMVGDVELWLKISAQYPVLRLQKGLVFWRQHEDQEYRKGFVHYLEDGSKIVLAAMNDQFCPLLPKEKERVIINLKKRTETRLYRFLFTTMDVKKFVKLHRSLKNMFRGNEMRTPGNGLYFFL